MSNANPDERRLGEQLRHEAFASAPGFSSLLHARIMQALEEDQTDVAHSQRRRAPWALIATAACIGLIAAMWWIGHRGATRTEQPMAQVGPTPSSARPPKATSFNAQDRRL